MDQTGSARSYPTSRTARCRRDRKAQGPEKGRRTQGTDRREAGRKGTGREEARPKEGRRKTGRTGKGGESENRKGTRARKDKTRQRGRAEAPPPSAKRRCAEGALIKRREKARYPGRTGRQAGRANGAEAVRGRTGMRAGTVGAHRVDARPNEGGGGPVCQRRGRGGAGRVIERRNPHGHWRCARAGGGGGLR
eukprot:360114-Chlamydomonas_euryale.AAC.1